MNKQDIRSELDRLHNEKEQQEAKVNNITEGINKLKQKLIRESNKLDRLNEKINGRELYIFKEMFKEVGETDENGVESLLAAYLKNENLTDVKKLLQGEE